MYFALTQILYIEFANKKYPGEEFGRNETKRSPLQFDFQRQISLFFCQKCDIDQRFQFGPSISQPL